MINAWDLSKILIKYKCAMNLIVAYSWAIFGFPFRALHIAETITDEEIKVNWHIFRNRIKAEIMWRSRILKFVQQKESFIQLIWEGVCIVFSTSSGRFLWGGITLKPHTVVQARQAMQLFQDPDLMSVQSGRVRRHPTCFQRTLCKVAVT